jgi:leucyl aminopeptidase
MPVTVTTAGKAPARADLLVRAARADRLAADLAAAGVDEGFAEASGFTGQVHQTLLAPGGKGPDVLVVGAGDAAEVGANRLRSVAGTAGRRTTKHAKVAVALAEAAAEGLEATDAAQAVAEGWLLGAYRFDAHRSSPPATKLSALTLTAGTARAVKDAVARGVAVAGAVNATRDLVNEPGGSLVPADLADRIRALAAASGLKVRVDGLAAIRRKGLGGVLGVAQGATNEPRFVELTYEPKGRARGHVALVGKGVTFDTGGYSLKPSDSMKGMNGDMGGAAAVVGAMSLLPLLGAPVKVTGYLPLVENMIGPDAMRVGDVLTTRGGTTVEVLNTDAEGRLILADGLRLASEAKPDAIVDLATLTGACMVALGPRVAGLFGDGDALVARVRAAADTAGEDVWPMPSPAHLRPGLDSDVADIRNISGGRYAGASVAALFLRHFVADGIPWAHLDIAGPSWITDGAVGEIPKLGTGFGVRLLAELLRTWEPLG